MGTMMKNALRLTAVATLGAAIGAPGPVERGRTPTIDGIVADLRAGGAQDRELVDAAIVAVNAGFPYHSVWHMWESPGRALTNGRGWSHQYNTVLLEVLRRLGFEVRLVHAARVRGWRHPWFFASHTWVKVTIDGYVLDACASRADNRSGAVGFVPVTDEMPYRLSTRVTVPLALAPFVVAAVWRAWLTGDEPPGWLYRRR